MSVNVQVQEKESNIAVSGGTVYVKSWIPSKRVDSVPVFLFHDSLGCVELWRDFPKSLAEKTGKIVIAYDRLGFGKSSARSTTPSIRFIEEEAEIYFPAVLQQLGFKEFDLFGHSVGGAMAIACAAQVPGCRSVITESAQAFVEDRTINGILKAKADFRDAKNFSRLQKYHADKASWVLKAWTDVWLSAEFSGFSLAAILPKVTCPALAIHGDQDEYGSIEFPKMIQRLAGGPSEIQVIANGGHVPHREDPQLILRLVQDFYSQV